MPRIGPGDSDDTGTASSDASTTDAEEEEYDRERTREELTDDATAPAGAPVDSTTNSSARATDGITDGSLNDGRRATNEQRTGTEDTSGGRDNGTGTSSGSSTGGELPDGRRIPDEQAASGEQTEGGQDSDSSTGAEVVDSSTTAQGAEEFGEGEVRSQASELESEVVENNEAITDESQVRVVKEGESLRAELTTQGEEAVEQAQRQQVRQQVADETEGVSADQVQVTTEGGETNVSLTEEGQAAAAGTLAASLQGGRRNIQEESLRNRVAESAGSGVESEDVSVAFEDGVATASIDADVREVAGRQGGQRDIQEQSLESRIAESSGNAVEENEVDVALSDSGDASVEISEDVRNVAGPEGGRRSLQEESLENAAGQSSEQFDASNFEANVTDSGGSVALNESTRASLIREQVAGQREEVQADDVEVSFNSTGGASVELDRSAREDVAANQIASERAGVDSDDVDVQFDENGEIVGAEVEENFDDDGRFLGVPGAEDDVESVVNAVGDFTGGVGQGVGEVIGGAVQVGANVTGLSPEGENEIADFSSDVGNRVGRSLNVTQLLTASDEVGEYIGESAARIYNGNADTIGPDTQESITRTVEPLKSDFAENPARATAGLVGSVAVTGGAFKAAQGTRLEGVARATLQPAEEAFAAATGVRAGQAARSGLSSAASRIDLPTSRSFSSSNRAMARFDRSTGRSDAEQTQRQLTGEETASDFDKPVSELNVSESTRQQVLENTARQDTDSNAVINAEADLSLRQAEADALRNMPPARAFNDAGEFSRSYQRHLDRVESESGTNVRTETAESVSTGQALPTRNVITLGLLSSTDAAREPDLVDGIEPTADATRAGELAISASGLSGEELSASTVEGVDGVSEDAQVSGASVDSAIDTGLEQQVEVGTDTGVSLESGTRQRTQTRPETAVETDVAVQTEQESEAAAAAFESAAGSSRERERFGELLGGSEQQYRPENADGEEQRFDFGDLDLL